MLLKNLPLYALPIIFFRLILDAIAGAKFISEGKLRHCIAIVKAHFSFYSRIPILLIKRRRTRKIESSIKYRKSIIIQYYFLKNKKFSQLKW